MTLRKPAFLLAVSALALGVAAPAAAQTAAHYMQPYGSGASASQPNAASRDENGNRVIINGLMGGGSGVGTMSGGVGQERQRQGLGSATAIGNQLNVVVNGNWNTVVVNSNQTNTGNVTANGESDQGSNGVIIDEPHG